jgi:hypothetical protein
MKRIAVGKTLVALIVVAALASVAITSKHTVPPVYAGSGCSAATLEWHLRGHSAGGVHHD